MANLLNTNRAGSGVEKNSMTRLLLISGLVVVVDQITKAAVVRTLVLHETIPVINGFFNLTHILNPGGAFGLFAENSQALRKFLFLFVSTIVAGVVFWMYQKTPREYRWFSWALALIFGGALGNLIDRFRYGKVVDFLDFYLGGCHWPAFNLADSAITMGMTVFLCHILFNRLPDL